MNKTILSALVIGATTLALLWLRKKAQAKRQSKPYIAYD